MPAGHGHQLEDRRVWNPRRTRRPAEHIVVAMKGLLHLDAWLAVEGERYHLVDESIAHQCQSNATIAIAWVSVCDSDTVLRVNPALATASATAPLKARSGAPAGSRVTSTSRQRMASAQPVPSALSAQEVQFAALDFRNVVKAGAGRAVGLHQVDFPLVGLLAEPADAVDVVVDVGAFFVLDRRRVAHGPDHEHRLRRLGHVQGIAVGEDDVVAGALELVRRYPDRKSTRLNSSHVRISYAVFCLKKKKNRH